MTPPILSIAGHSNSGKTTLIERLIPELSRLGYRVGTIKHDAHNFVMDHEGKDTWRMSQAGAQTVVIASATQMAMTRRLDTEAGLEEIASWLFKDVDIIIAEGYKRSAYPKIEVVRHSPVVCAEDPQVKALVDNREENAPDYLFPFRHKLACFRMTDLSDITDFVLQLLIRK